MKYCLTILGLLLWVLQVGAQHPHNHAGHPHNCGTHASPEAIRQMHHLRINHRSTESDFIQTYNSRSRPPISYVPIQVHIMRTSTGTGGLTTTQLNNAIAELNSYYINANMEFYQCSAVNYIDDDNYYDFDSADESAVGAANDASNVVNVYFANTVASSGTAVCGYAYLPSTFSPDRLFVRNSCIGGKTFIHEMGHFFGLYHTHGKTNNGTTDELVDGSNCATAGDDICDTPADPNLSGLVTSSCLYTGTATDSNGDTYVPDPTNIMSYSRQSCRTIFSTGQYARMYNVLLNHPARNNYSCSTSPANDPCNSAITISNCGPNAAMSYTGVGFGVWDTSYCNTTSIGQEQVYVFTPSVSGTYTLEVTTANGAVNYGWRASSCSPVNGNCVGSISTTGSYNLGNWVAGVDYYLVLDDVDTVPGNHQFYIGCACETVSNIVANNVTDSSALISWVAPSSGTPALGYEIRYQARGDTTWIMDTTFATNYFISGLNCGTTYTVQVRTDCGTSFGNWQSSQGFTTTACFPHTVSGTVQNASGNFLVGVTVSFMGSPGTANGNFTAVTNPNGFYTLSLPNGWSGTATPIVTGSTFNVRTYSILTTSLSGQNFTEIPPAVLYTISGSVRDANNVFLAGVSVEFVGSGTNSNFSGTTNSNGEYVVSVPAGWSGTAVPVVTGANFNSRTYTNVNSNLTGQNFVEIPAIATYTISGSVRDVNNAFLAGATVEFTGSGTNGNFSATTSNNRGMYSVNVPAGWSGTATVNFPGSTFNTRTHTNVNSNLTGQNFVELGGPVIYTISGSVRDVNNAFLAGINVTFTGSGINPNAMATTDANGNYTVSVPDGWSGTATPTLMGSTFNTRTHTNVNSNLTGQNFVELGGPVMYTITGSVRDANDVFLSGETVVFTGSGGNGNFSGTTNGNGVYMVSVPAGWSGTATVNSTSLTFITRTHSNVSSNLSGQNFKATGTLDAVADAPVQEDTDFGLVEKVAVKCYPNPNQGRFILDLGRAYQEIQISIYDVSQRLVVAREYYGADKIELDLRQPTGVYVVRIATEEGMLETVKVVIQ